MQLESHLYRGLRKQGESSAPLTCISDSKPKLSVKMAFLFAKGHLADSLESALEIEYPFAGEKWQLAKK